MRSLAILFIALVSLTSRNYSQEIDELHVIGGGTYLPYEIIAKRDINGNHCSALIILTDLKALTYDSYNGIIEVNKDFPGKHVVFLTPDERNVEVYCFGYKPLKINLYDYGIVMGEGKAWQLEISAEKQIELLPVSISVYPPNSTLIIDNNITDFQKSVKLIQGEHNVRIECDNYVPIDTVINVDMESVLFGFKMETQQKLEVTFNSLPFGAGIYLDDNKIGETNMIRSIAGGRYNLRAVKENYIAYEKEIEIKPGENNIFDIELKKNIGNLELELASEDCEVRINNQFYADRKIELEPGKYELDIRKQGYTTNKSLFEITAGKTIFRKITLIKNSTVLNINLYPEDATVKLNDISYQSYDKIDLAPGEYRVVVSKDGYESITEILKLIPGDNISKSYRLIEQKGILELTVEPFSASVKLLKNGKLINTWMGHNTTNELQTGDYRIVVEKEGFKKQEKDIRIQPDQTSKEEITLQMGYDYFSIDISSDEELEILIDGKDIGRSSESELEVPTGLHAISLRRNNEIIHTEEYRFNEESLNRLDISNKSKLPFILESVLFPGFGQYLNESELKGGIFAAVFMGSVIYHILNNSEYNNKTDELNNAFHAFNSSTNMTEKLYAGLRIEGLKNEADKLYDKTNTSLYIAAGIYVLNLLDAIIFNETNKQILFVSGEQYSLDPYIAIDNIGKPSCGIRVRF